MPCLGNPFLKEGKINKMKREEIQSICTVTTDCIDQKYLAALLNIFRMMWAAGTVAAMSSITFPAVSALISRNAESDQQGKICTSCILYLQLEPPFPEIRNPASSITRAVDCSGTLSQDHTYSFCQEQKFCSSHCSHSHFSNLHSAILVISNS